MFDALRRNAELFDTRLKLGHDRRGRTQPRKVFEAVLVLPQPRGQQRDVIFDPDTAQNVLGAVAWHSSRWHAW